MAYDIPESRQYLLSGPDWLESEHFDISAKYDPQIKDDEIAPMLKSLLEERFKLTTHRESRQISGYALILGKNGPKLKPAANPMPFTNFPRTLCRTRRRNFCLDARSGGSAVSVLPFQLDRPVIDFTELTGRFDLTLDWATTDLIFSALDEQLGLKLEARKIPLEVLVVDRATKTSLSD